MPKEKTHKQTFWFTIINYIGIVIGALSTIFIYPKNTELIGIIGFIDSTAQMLFPVLVFGSAQAIIHFSSLLDEKNKKNLFLYGIDTILSIFLFIFLLIVIGNIFSSWNKYHYLYYILPLALALALIELFKKQAITLQKITVPTFYEKIIPKLTLPFLFILFLQDYFTQKNTLIGFVVAYFFLFILLAHYLRNYFSFSDNFSTSYLFSKLKKKDYYSYTLYAFLASFGSFLAFRIDGFMIPVFLDFNSNGIYKIATNLASALAIPATGLFAISSPQISTLIKENNLKKLGIKYTENAKLLFFIGAILLGCIFVGIEPFFKMLPMATKLLPAVPVIFILGSNILINMATGFSTEIILYSKYYKFNIVILFILVGLNIGLNVLFLTQTSLGVIGVAYASFIALFLFNSIKMIFIYKKFKLLPFDINYLYLFIIMTSIIVLVYCIPLLGWFGIIGKISILILLSLIIVHKLKLVHSYSKWVDSFL